MTSESEPAPEPPGDESQPAAAAAAARGLVLRRDDYGAFRAAEPGTGDVLLLRPIADGLAIERSDGFELVPWAAVTGIDLTQTTVGRVGVPTARLLLEGARSIDYADALAAGAERLPMTLGPGQPSLLRVERFRLLTAAVAAAAGLAPASTERFHRGPRAVPQPELALRPRILPTWAPPALLVASIAALMFLFDMAFSSAIAVTVVLLLHEIGHAIAMRAVRMKVRGVLFLPAIGAATVPEHGFPSRWDEARVALAGPVTGIPVAVVAVVLIRAGAPPHPVLVGIVTALIVNLANLAPLMPLDGGRVLLCLTAGLPRRIRTALTFAPLVLVVAGLFAVYREPPALPLALLLAFSFVVTRLALRRQGFHSWMHALPLHVSSLRASLRDVTHAVSGAAREDVDGGVPAAPLTAGQAAAVIVIYIVEVIALTAVSIAVMALLPEFRDLLRIT